MENRSYSVPSMYYHITDEELHQMSLLRQKGYTNAEIARKTGRPVNTVWRHLGCQPKILTQDSCAAATAAKKLRAETARKLYVKKLEAEDALNAYDELTNKIRALEKRKKNMEQKATDARKFLVSLTGGFLN